MVESLKRMANGPSIVDGICISRGPYCSSCNGADVVNCRRGSEYHKR